LLIVPYTVIVLVNWLIFVVWYLLLGIPMGPGYPTKL
jgi:p-aminobenzoyl-glutamate transporter AbgT